MTDFVFTNRRNLVSAGTLLRVPDRSEENKVNVRKKRLWLCVDSMQEQAVTVLSDIGGRVCTAKGTLFAVTPTVLEGMKEYIAGFAGIVVPVPSCDGLLWNETAAKEAETVGELYDIFDDEVIESSIRGFYYEKIERHIISEYIIPIYEKARSMGIEISFYMGDGKIQYDFMPILNPITLVCMGIPVSFGGYSREKAAVCSLMDKACFIIDGDELFCVEYKRRGNGRLLVIPNRACRDRYLYSERENKRHLETPALCKAAEGSFYFDRLWKAGLEFDMIDESALENYACIEDGSLVMPFGKYKEVYTCPSCVFCGACADAINGAKRAGILINPPELASIINNENTEDTEWEK